MKKEEIISLSGEELTVKLNNAYREGRIGLKEYKKILDFWYQNKDKDIDLFG